MRDSNPHPLVLSLSKDGLQRAALKWRNRGGEPGFDRLSPSGLRMRDSNPHPPVLSPSKDGLQRAALKWRN
ncbi:MAG TPA: hypothetical protein VF552_11790, partial [Allosphingosinicella sp.]